MNVTAARVPIGVARRALGAIRLAGRLSHAFDSVLTAGSLENARRAAVESATRRRAFLVVQRDERHDGLAKGEAV